MPNWCSNGITLRHEDPAMIDRVIKGKEGLLMEFLPTPQPLMDTTAQGGSNEQEQANLKEHGYASWYDWNINNWGTKWDFSLESVDRIDDNTVSAAFDSAWSPPLTAYEKLMELGFEITAYYYEPGMGFVGKWEDGLDECYEYHGQDSDTVRDYIGEELDDYFAISEQMADWEEENQED